MHESRYFELLAWMDPANLGFVPETDAPAPTPIKRVPRKKALHGSFCPPVLMTALAVSDDEDGMSEEPPPTPRTSAQIAGKSPVR